MNARAHLCARARATTAAEEAEATTAADVAATPLSNDRWRCAIAAAKLQGASGAPYGRNLFKNNTCQRQQSNARADAGDDIAQESKMVSNMVADCLVAHM